MVRHEKVRLLIYGATALVLVCGLLLLGPFMRDQIYLRQARAGFQRELAELPMPEGFEMVTVISGNSSMNVNGKTCYYAGASIVLGSHFPPHEALQRYVRALQDQGWRLAERRQYSEAKFLIRSEQEYVSVRLGRPGFLVEMDQNYRKAQERYTTFIYLSVRYILPGFKGC